MGTQPDFTTRDVSVSVGASSVELSPLMNNYARDILVITNTSTGGQVISIGVGQDAVAGLGIVMQPGQSYIESLDSAFTPTNDRITAIASAAGGASTIHERAHLIGRA